MDIKTDPSCTSSQSVGGQLKHTLAMLPPVVQYMH